MLLGWNIQKVLKTIPYLAQFIDSIFSLGFKDLVQIKGLTDAATEKPHSEYSSEKWTLALPWDHEPEPADVAPPDLPDTLLMLDYGKNPLHPDYTPTGKQEDKENH